MTSMMIRRGRIISNSTLSCPSCSNAVEETDDSIKCDKCDSWFHHSCTKLPNGALAILEADGCFWFCSACTKSVKKVLSVDKLEIAKDIEEIKASINEIKAKSIPSISNDPTVNSRTNDNITHYPKQQQSLEIKIAGIDEYHSKEQNEKVGPLQTVEHDKTEVEKVFNHLCEDLSCVSDVRRLGKWKPDKNRPRPLLLSLTNPWTARKILSRAHTMNEYNKANNCRIYVGKSLTKDEQELEKKCLSMRWKLINEKYYSRDSLKIRNLKLFHNNVEVNISE